MKANTTKTYIEYATVKRALKAWTLLAVIVAFSGNSSNASTILMNGNDSSGASSFNAGTNWVGGIAPTSGNDYVDAQYDLRTPQAAGSFTFAGDSLTLGDGSSTAARFIIKSSSTDSTITINDFAINKGNIIQGGAVQNATLAGGITVLAGGATVDTGSSGRVLDISASISGTGAISVNAAAGILRYTGTNSYSGGTSVGGGALLDVRVDGGLGTGNISVLSAGKLTLELGVSHNYIADNATLSIVSGLAASSINLGFTGVDTIGNLSLDGGSTFLSAGTYSTADLNSAYGGSGVFIGAGQLQVVPEPSTGILVGLGLAVVLYGWRRRVA